MNITDVDDKIIRNASPRKTLAEYTANYTDAFLEDSAALRLQRPERMVKATEHIQEMVGAIEKLAERGYHLPERRVHLLSASRSSPATANFRTTISPASAPARASTWTNTTKPTPAISSYGKLPRMAKCFGKAGSVRAARAGTSNAPRWP